MFPLAVTCDLIVTSPSTSNDDDKKLLVREVREKPIPTFAPSELSIYIALALLDTPKDKSLLLTPKY